MGTDGRSVIKLHRRSMLLDGRPRTLLTMRPKDRRVFATNHFHRVWHIIGSHGAGHVFGQLCWVMAHQTQPDTLLLIDPRFIVSNPFDADPSMPILLVNADLCGVSSTLVRDVKRMLPLRSAPEGTLKARTTGLEKLVAAGGDLAGWQRDRGGPHRIDQRGRIEPVNGVLVLWGSTASLAHWAVECWRLGRKGPGSEDIAELWYDERAGSGWWLGEFQSFPTFERDRSRAERARAALFPGSEHHELSYEERREVWISHLDEASR